MLKNKSALLIGFTCLFSFGVFITGLFDSSIKATSLSDELLFFSPDVAEAHGKDHQLSVKNLEMTDLVTYLQNLNKENE